MSTEHGAQRQVRETIGVLESARLGTTAPNLQRALIVAECDLLDLALKNHSPPAYPASQKTVQTFPG